MNQLNKQTITINQIPPNLNQIIFQAKRHWGLYNSAKQKWKKIIAECVNLQGIKPITGKLKIKVSYVYPTKARRDPDNYVLKFILDGLVNSGILVDDSWQYIKEIVYQEPEYSKGISRTIIVLENIN